MDLEQARQLQAITDRQEIEQVLKLYCRAVDRCDLDLLKSVYHPDGTDNHGMYSGNAHEFAEMLIPLLKKLLIDGMHTVTHATIDLHGDFATSEAYYWAYQQAYGGVEAVTAYFGKSYAQKARAEGTLDGPHDYFCGGRYIDLFERRNGQWRILRRQLTNEWNDVRPSTRIVSEGQLAHLNLPGRRDRSDPVYSNTVPLAMSEVSAT